MSRKVCFIDQGGHVATCIHDDEESIECKDCPFVPDDYFRRFWDPPV